MPRTPLCLLAALAACGDTPAQAPDAGAPPADAPLVDVPATDDAPADTPVEPPTAPRIDDVRTDLGFHQIRQGETVRLVVRGARLAAATGVVLGDNLPATVVDAADAQLTVSVRIPHGLPPQALALAVTTPDGTATLAGAIDTTAYIVALAAAPGGHGTHESPLALCEVTDAEPGDVIEIGPGTYHCDARLTLAPGVAVRGAGRTQTELAGFGIDFPDAIDPRPSAVSDLTIVDAGIAITAGPFGGALEVARVDLRGGNAVGIELEPDLAQPFLPVVTLAELTYEGSGVAIRGDARLAVTGSRLSGCATGIQTVDGEVQLAGTQITGCTTGIASGLPMHRNDVVSPPIQLTDVQITGATAPIAVQQAAIQLVRTQLVGAADCTTGIRIADGSVTATDSRVECAGTALLGDGVSFLEDAQRVSLTRSEVIGGVNGVVLAGANDPSLLRAQGSHVHGGSRAAVSLEDGDARAELGTAGAPGGNQLTSDTGVAFRDLRADPAPNEITEAHGTTLNGHAYDGQTITGPATFAHDYALGADSRLVF